MNSADKMARRWRGTDEKYPMNEGHDTAEEPILTGYLSVTVGTAIANCPPYRSVRAELPHTAPTLDG
jgi:hypothetical protein